MTTTWVPEHTSCQGAPATAGQSRPTAAVSGGEYGLSGDSRVQPALVGADAYARSAVLSPDRSYRYLLTRRWGSGSRALFVGLNSSTADATVDDASTRRMVGFARSAGCGSLTLVNLYAWRSTSPSVLRHVPDPVGPDNDAWISYAAAGADVVVAAWGTHADTAREANVIQLLAHNVVWCLGRTKDGHPRHPLYVAARTQLEIYRPDSHDWEDWTPVSEPGTPEPLRERICSTCQLDEIDVDYGQMS